MRHRDATIPASVRRYLYRRLREGLERVMREHPDLDPFALSPETEAAEEAIERACVDWYHFKLPLRAVAEKFKLWEAALLKANGLPL